MDYHLKQHGVASNVKILQLSNKTRNHVSISSITYDLMNLVTYDKEELYTTTQVAIHFHIYANPIIAPISDQEIYLKKLSVLKPTHSTS